MPTVSNHLKLLSDHRSAHVLHKVCLTVRPELKVTGVIFRIPVKIAEFHLALTLNRCKCELLLTICERTAFLGHFLDDEYTRGQAQFSTGGHKLYITATLVVNVK